MSADETESPQPAESAVELHARRVEDARRKLTDDFRHLSQAGQRLERRSTRVALGVGLLGGAVLLGVVAARIRYRWRARGAIQSSRLSNRLVRAALRTLLLRMLESLALRMAVRTFPLRPDPRRLPANGDTA